MPKVRWRQPAGLGMVPGGNIHKPNLRKDFSGPAATDVGPGQSVVSPTTRKSGNTMNKKMTLLAAAAAFSLLATQGAQAQKKYDTGASDTEIKIGNVEAYRGPACAHGIIGKTAE